MAAPLQSVLLLNHVLQSASFNSSAMNLSLLTDIIFQATLNHEIETIPILAAHETIYDLEGFISNFHSTFQKSTYIFSTKTSNFYFRYLISRESLVLAFINGIHDPVLDMTDTYTTGIRRLPVLFILTRPPQAQSEIKDIMLRTWKSHYIHAVFLYKDLDGYDHLDTFNPYPEFRLVNLIDIYKNTDIWLLPDNGNLNGYKIRSPLKFDLPRVFKVKDPRGGTQFRGYGYELFMTFVHEINATFEEYSMNVNKTNINVIMKDIIELIKIGEIEVSLHPHIVRENKDLGNSYPIRASDACIMLPMANEIPRYMYLRRPLQWKVWLMILFAVMYMASTLMWITPNSKHKHHQEFGLTLLQSVGYILNMPSWDYTHNVTWRYFFVHKASWILGFFITSWYCAILQSFLNVTVFGPQIDTMEELIASGLNILVSDYDIEIVVNMTHVPKDFINIFVSTTADLLAKHQITLNTTYAYAMGLDRWEFLNLQQQYSKRPIFRKSNICFFKHHLAYQLALESPLQYLLNFFILRAQQAGLLEYWTRADFGFALREGYVKLMMDSFDVKALNFENLRLAWLGWGIGLCISAAVFTTEYFILAKQKESFWVICGKKCIKIVQRCRMGLKRLEIWWKNR